MEINKVEKVSKASNNTYKPRHNDIITTTKKSTNEFDNLLQQEIRKVKNYEQH